MIDLSIRRGHLVSAVISGDFGKPRPALVMQSDAFADHPSTTVLPLTSHLIKAPLIRINVQPDARNGLVIPSQIMIDKITAIRRARIGSVLGAIDPVILDEVYEKLMRFLGE